MPLFAPTTLEEAVAIGSDHPDALLLAGGTDLMVSINEQRVSPTHDTTIISLGRIPSLTSWSINEGRRRLSLGAGITWTELEREPLRSFAPALADAARTVGSPQIRNAGTIGGNVATASPAGDGLPVLAAHDATVHMIGANGARSLPFSDFMLGPKRTAREPGEVITAIEFDVLDGPQGYAKVGVRNAMVIATASVCVAVDRPSTSVRIALGSVGPTILRADEAERLVAERADWDAATISDETVAAAGEAAGSASRPIDDHRSTAAYRRHAVQVLTQRLLRRAFPGAAE